jgi:tetratricopeptide (TPR) repeat protein
LINLKRNKKAHALKRVDEKGVPKALTERLDAAQELVYDGWEILAFDAREAKRCFSQAIALFEDLLARNPNDNQGVRYLVAPTYLLKDDLPGALKAFDWFERHYAEDIPDPHFLLNWGLASYMAGRFEDAAMRFRSVFFANPYLLPLVLGRKPKVLPIWHSDNLMRIDYAREYFDWFGGLWSDRDDARGFVGFVWDDVEIRAGFRQWKKLWTEIDGLEVSDLRSSLIDKAREIETSELSRTFFLRLKSFLDSLARPF